MANTRTTGTRAASAAGKTLNNLRATSAEKSAAASALAQAGNTRQTSSKAASAAARTLGDPKATRAEKSAAASALSQRTGKASKRS